MSSLFLKWSSHQELLTSLEQLLEESSFVDVTIAVEGVLLKAHKVILCASSPYFREILASNPSPHTVIFMRDVKLVEMKAILDFIYKGETCVSQDNLPGILKSADAMKITGLSNITWSDATINNVQDADTFESDKESNPEETVQEEDLSLDSFCTQNPLKKTNSESVKPTSSSKSFCGTSADNTLCSVTATGEGLKESTTLMMEQDVTHTILKTYEESPKATGSVIVLGTPSEITPSVDRRCFPYRKYTKHDLQQALDLVRQGQMGIKPAARAFNIPVATLNHAARRNKITSPMQQGGNYISFKPWQQNKGGTSIKWDHSWD